MAKPTKPVSHYELRLYKRFGIQYKILPTEEWHGLRTHANIYCSIHKSSRFVWLQKVFNGRNSTWACRQCYLDSLKPTPLLDSPPTETELPEKSNNQVFELESVPNDGCNHNCAVCQANIKCT